MQRLAYSIDETAELLGLSRSLIYRLMDAGQLNYVKAGARRRIIPAESVREFLGSAEAGA